MALYTRPSGLQHKERNVVSANGKVQISGKGTGSARSIHRLATSSKLQSNKGSSREHSESNASLGALTLDTVQDVATHSPPSASNEGKQVSALWENYEESEDDGLYATDEDSDGGLPASARRSPKSAHGTTIDESDEDPTGASNFVMLWEQGSTDHRSTSTMHGHSPPKRADDPRRSGRSAGPGPVVPKSTTQLTLGQMWGR